MAERRISRSRLGLVRAAADVTAVLAVFIAAAAVWQPSHPALHAVFGAGMALIVVSTYAHLGLYRRQTTVLNLLELRSALEGALLAAATFLAAVFVSGIAEDSGLEVTVAAAGSVVFLFVERRLMAAWRASWSPTSGYQERTLVYGYTAAGRLLMKKIVQAPESGRRLVGFVDDFVPEGTSVSFRVERANPGPVSIPLLGRTEDLKILIQDYDITEILFASPAVEADGTAIIEPLLSGSNIRWGAVAHLGTAHPEYLHVDSIGGIPVLRPARPRSQWYYEAAKRVLDLLFAAVALLATLPLWALISVAIVIESGTPVLFKQERVGRVGRRFLMYKFRSLRADTDPYQSKCTLRADQITGVGRLLRLTALDELPQLINVLRGEMSLVGPRPEMPFLVDTYSALERRRLTVTPGITGVWQLSPDRLGREIHEAIEFDLFYLTSKSLLLDLVLLHETFLFAVGSAWSAFRSPAPAGAAETSAVSTPRFAGMGGYVLVALDQRQDREAFGRKWRLIADELVRYRQSVTVLASASNLRFLHSTLASLTPPNGIGERVRFVLYRDRSTLRTAVRDASVLITDVEYFSQLGRAENTELQVLDVPGEPAMPIEC